LAACHLTNGVGDRELDRLVREANRPAVGAHDLEVAGRSAELRPGLEEGLIAGLERAERLVLDLRGPVSQRCVEGAAELVAHDEIDGRRGEDNRERHGRCGGKGESAAEAHGSRKA
jgi:hypothetical protein